MVCYPDHFCCVAAESHTGRGISEGGGNVSIPSRTAPGGATIMSEAFFSLKRERQFSHKSLSSQASRVVRFADGHRASSESSEDSKDMKGWLLSSPLLLPH